MGVVAGSHTEPLLEMPESMRYRPLGRTGLRVSALSMGCMRLGEDQEVNTAAVARAVELGINYFETTRFYCGGQCQQRTAPGLSGKTGGVIVSGKAGIDANTTAASFRREMERQLEILGLSHFKFFQVGWFGWNRVGHLLKRGGVLDALRRAQDEGLVQFIGFTGHDTPEHFTRIIETGLFDSLTVPYSLLNRMYEGTIARAGALGVGVVAMCPVAGGVLADDSSKLRDALQMDLPTAAMALRFVLANPHVSTACSGMTSAAMVEDNAQAVHAFDPEGADFEALCEGVERLRDTLGEKVCTACRYCLPCPKDLDIPRLLELYRNWKVYGLESGTVAALRALPEEKRPFRCSSCGQCTKKCPNDLDVGTLMRELAEVAHEGA